MDINNYNSKVVLYCNIRPISEAAYTKKENDFTVIKINLTN